MQAILLACSYSLLKICKIIMHVVKNSVEIVPGCFSVTDTLESRFEAWKQSKSVERNVLLYGLSLHVERRHIHVCFTSPYVVLV